MPPKDSGKQLAPSQIELLKRWIAEGAAWSLAWAYVPPKRVEPPKIRDDQWPRNWVDRHILARLDREGLKPASEADKVTLVRRLYIDLLGLPPKPEEVAAFVADNRLPAYEELVDRLLASEHFGERMAMYWLDLVRYADTVGYHGDQDQSISPYRDYVIQAFNRNLPFDQFTREQLAGDLLPDSTQLQKIASGYNRVLQTSHEGGVQPKEYLAIYAADRVRNLSSVWMGATVGCAQCHDHKFDPYTTRDFYSLEAFFADIDEAKHFSQGTNALPTRRPPELDLPTDAQRAEIATLERQLITLKQELKAAESRTRANRGADDVETAPPSEAAASEPSSTNGPTSRITPAGNKSTRGRRVDRDKSPRSKSKTDVSDETDALSSRIADYEKQLKSIQKNVAQVHDYGVDRTAHDPHFATGQLVGRQRPHRPARDSGIPGKTPSG